MLLARVFSKSRKEAVTDARRNEDGPEILVKLVMAMKRQTSMGQIMSRCPFYDIKDRPSAIGWPDISDSAGGTSRRASRTV